MTNQIKAATCPTCNTELGAATGISDPSAHPSPGDVTICFYCCTVLEYTQDLDLEPINITSLQPEVRDVIAMTVVQLQSMRDPRRLH